MVLGFALPLASLANAESVQSEADEYTRYELLAPETASFKIYYEVTATTAGAKYFYNPIRKGSVASDESVYDAMLGKPLHFEVVSGAEARKDALMSDADAATDYIKVTLARPVPQNGQVGAAQRHGLRTGLCRLVHHPFFLEQRRALGLQRRGPPRPGLTRLLVQEADALFGGEPGQSEQRVPGGSGGWIHAPRLPQQGGGARVVSRGAGQLAGFQQQIGRVGSRG